METQPPSRHFIRLRHRRQLTSGTPFPAESRLAYTLPPVPSALPYLASSPSAASDSDAPANGNKLPTSLGSKPSGLKPKPSKWRTRIPMHFPTTRLRHPSSRALTAQSATPRAELLVLVAALLATTLPSRHRQCHYLQRTVPAASGVPAPADSIALAKAASPPTVA